LGRRRAGGGGVFERTRQHGLKQVVFRTTHGASLIEVASIEIVA
jgi:hypothetical protein